MTRCPTCAALGVSRRLAYRMISAGALPCYRFGGTGRKIVVTEAHVAECRRRHESGVERDGEDAPPRGGRGAKPMVPDFDDMVKAVGRGRR